MTGDRGAPARWRPIKGLHRRWKDGWLAEGGTAERRGALIDMLVFDHGLLRCAWRNLHEVAPGVWRGGQPDPAQLRRLALRGFRAIVNLRGATEWGSYLLEREACAKLGLTLVDIKMNSRVLPDRETVLKLDEIFATVDKPLLIHCKSGSDRSGFAAALYLLLRADAPPEAALAQLSLRYLHLRRGGTGVLSHMIDAYARARSRGPIGFRDWIRTGYDPEALMAEFRDRPAARLMSDHLLRRE